MKELFWYLGQYGGLSETSLEAPEDPGDAVHLVVGETLQLSVHVERVRGRWLVHGSSVVIDLCNVRDWIEIESRLRFRRN